MKKCFLIFSLMVVASSGFASQFAPFLGGERCPVDPSIAPLHKAVSNLGLPKYLDWRGFKVYFSGDTSNAKKLDLKTYIFFLMNEQDASFERLASFVEHDHHLRRQRIPDWHENILVIKNGFFMPVIDVLIRVFSSCDFNDMHDINDMATCDWTETLRHGGFDCRSDNILLFLAGRGDFTSISKLLGNGVNPPQELGKEILKHCYVKLSRVNNPHHEKQLRLEFKRLTEQLSKLYSPNSQFSSWIALSDGWDRLNDPSNDVEMRE